MVKIRNIGKTVLVMSIFVFLSAFAAGLANAGDIGPEFRHSFELKIPENSLITSVETDGYSGVIHYTTKNGCDQSIEMERPPVWGMLGGYERPFVGEIQVFVEGNTAGLDVEKWPGGYHLLSPLTDMEGKVVQEFTASRMEIYSVSGVHYTSQWRIKVKFSNNVSGNWDSNCAAGNGGANNGGDPGNQPATKPVKAEGFIQEISLENSAVVIGKEGKNKDLLVTSSTKITLNKQVADIEDLRVNDKIEKAIYDPSTNKLLQLHIKREQ